MVVGDMARLAPLFSKNHFFSELKNHTHKHKISFIHFEFVPPSS